MKYNWKEYYSQWDIYKAIEEENKKLKADTEHTIKFNNKIIWKLKLENDKMKVIIKNNDIEQKADWKHIEELEEENGTLKSELSKFRDSFKKYRDYEKEELAESCYDLARENEKLRTSIEYRKKKADANQEKANQIDKIMNLPWVMIDWKIDWSKVAVYYCI